MNDFKQNLSKDQSKFIDLVLSGKNIFLTGKAGTGKSHVVREAMKLLNQKGKNVAAIAPTGMAANHISGQTIHSMFSLNPFGIFEPSMCNFMRKEKKRMMDKIDVIFIDEVSMLRPDILDAMFWTLIKNQCSPLESKQIVFIGDLKQLPVVLDDNARSVLYEKGYEGSTFKDALNYKILDVVEIELNKVLRQEDEEFVNNLNIIREGGKSSYFKQFVTDTYSGVILAPHNSTVQKYNNDGLNSIDSELFEFKAKVHGNLSAEDFNLETNIKVKHGCKIMYLVNSKENPLRNGTLGEFIAVKRENDIDCFIRVSGVDYKMEKVEFEKKEYIYNHKKGKLELETIGSITQYPFRLAYALSIHKSQGMTFDEVTVDLTRRCFQEGQMYVALSRVKSPQGLKIIV